MNTHRILEQAGLRPTLPRVLLLEFFQQHPHVHFTAEQLYKRLNEDMRNLSLGTLYRALGLLVDAKLLCSVAFGDGRLVYELNDGKPHDHLICTSCGCIREFADVEIERRQRAFATECDFEISGRQMVVYGLCAECRKSAVRVRTVVRK